MVMTTYKPPLQKNLFGEVQQPPHPRRRYIKVPVMDYKAPLVPTNTGQMGRLEQSFWEFHKKNKEIYRMLVRFAREWRQVKGVEAKLGISLLFERVRWETSLKTNDEEFKLNNNHRAFYARLIMKYNPDLDGVFRMRRQRVQSTLGPDNNELPPGEHIS